jgi:uncharacterized protein YcaQ
MRIRKQVRPGMVAHGKEIAKAYMAKRLIGRRELFNSKLPEHVEKRKDLIRILSETGLYPIEIARVVQRNKDTIRYWTNPAYREDSLARANARLRRLREEATA